jgi:hypothetical protein
MSPKTTDQATPLPIMQLEEIMAGDHKHFSIRMFITYLVSFIYLVICSAGDLTWGLMHARQAYY